MLTADFTDNLGELFALNRKALVYFNVSEFCVIWFADFDDQIDYC